MIKASDEIIEHHINLHRAQCQTDEQTSAFLRCSCDSETEGHFAVIVCMGCFEIVFNAISPNENLRCKHALAFIKHHERNTQ
jgi:hypothetical protein